jgi:hypothetical protein
MLTPHQIRQGDKFACYLRGLGFVAHHTSTGWIAAHHKGVTVTGNLKRIKVERTRLNDENAPMVTVERGPAKMEWLDAQLQGAGL